jgi:hypothetical protein
MRIIAALFGAMLAIASPHAAKAAPSALVFSVISQPTLDALGITYIASGGASVSPGSPPVITAMVTGSSPVPGGELISASTSVIDFTAPGATFQIFGLVLNTALAELFSDLTVDPAGQAGPVVYNNQLLFNVQPNGDLLFAPALINTLSGLGINLPRDLVVAQLQPFAVPAPGALAVLGFGVVMLAGLRRRGA